MRHWVGRLGQVGGQAETAIRWTRRDAADSRPPFAQGLADLVERQSLREDGRLQLTFGGSYI